MATFRSGGKASSGKSFTLDYSENYNLIKKLKKLEGDIKGTSEKALKESQKYITKNLHTEMKKHHRTGKTEESLVENPRVRWLGTMAEIDVGFDISNGGLPSIFLMYGTPRMKKDQKLFNAIYGKRTSEEVAKIQAEIFYKEIRKLEGE